MQIPYKRRLRCDDPFFNEGNEECVQHIHKVHVDDDIDITMGNVDARHDVAEFPCEVRGCRSTLTSPMGYNRHFDAVHRYRCQHCNRNFPCDFLLGLHVAENHDSFFKAQVTRGIAVYRCFVVSCGCVFVTADERVDHAVEVHKYPADFRYNTTPRRRKHQKYQDSEKKGEEGAKTKDNEKMDQGQDQKSTMKKKKKTKKGGKDKMDVEGLSKENNILMDMGDSQNSLQQQQQQQQEQGGDDMDCNSSTPSVTNGDQLQKENVSDSMDNIMDTDCEIPLKTEKKRHIPKNISFGRGAHRGFSRTKYQF